MSDKPDAPDRQSRPIFRKARRLGCENRLIQVFLDDVATLSGESVENFLVLAPRQRSRSQVTGVAVLPVLGDRLGLLNVYRYPVEDYTWEVPRGFVDPDEDDMTAAIRELEEETGLSCEAAAMLDLGIVTPEPGIMSARTHLYAATRCRRVNRYKEGEMGHKEFRLFDAQTMARMVRGEVADTTTLAVWYRYLQATG